MWNVHLPRQFESGSLRPNELCICPDNGAARAKALVVNGAVVGPFEEEEEGTGITSDVVKVEGGDPATPGPLT